MLPCTSDSKGYKHPGATKSRPRWARSASHALLGPARSPALHIPCTVVVGICLVGDEILHHSEPGVEERGPVRVHLPELQSLAARGGNKTEVLQHVKEETVLSWPSHLVGYCISLCKLFL